MSNTLIGITTDELVGIIEAAVGRALAARAPANEAPPSEWLDVNEAGELLRLHPRTVARLAREGKIPSSRAGTHLRIRRADAAAYLASR